MINESAENLSKLNLSKFDMICVDVFKNRSVPAFAQFENFLLQCKNLMQPDGILFFNIIPKDAEKLSDSSFESNFKKVFQNYSSIKMKENEMWIGKNSNS